MITVDELVCYPIKGCAGTPLADALLTPAGLRDDRAFLIVDGDGVFRSQRRDPGLAVISPRVTADSTRLTVRAEGVEPLEIAVDESGERCEVSLFGDRYRGIDQGDEAAEWFSTVLGARSRLMRVPPEHDRVVAGITPGTSAYADSSAVHLLSRESWADLNRRVGAEVALARFRPNIVVSGAEPYAEDAIRRAEVGAAVLGFSKPAVRCTVTLVDQDRGVRAGPEPLRTLAGYRREAGVGVTFGAKFAVVRPGKLSVGDELAVTDWAN